MPGSPASPDQVDRSIPWRSPKNSGGSHGCTNTWISLFLARAQRASDRTFSLSADAGDQATTTARASRSARSIVPSHGADAGMSRSHQTSSPAARSPATSLPAAASSSRL
jgi:hypothetical protein